MGINQVEAFLSVDVSYRISGYIMIYRPTFIDLLMYCHGNYEVSRMVNLISVFITVATNSLLQH